MSDVIPEESNRNSKEKLPSEDERYPRTVSSHSEVLEEDEEELVQ